MKYSLKGERLDAIRKLYDDISKLAGIKNFNKLTIEDYVLANITKYSRDNNQPIFITTIPATRANEEQDALAIGNKTFAFNTTLKHFLKSLKILENKYGNRTEQSLSGVDWKAMMHCVRIIQQGIEYLQTKNITFPRNNREFLLQIKNGEFSEEFVSDFIMELFSQLKYQQEITSLQETSPELEKYFFNWLKLQMKGVYITYDVA